MPVLLLALTLSAYGQVSVDAVELARQQAKVTALAQVAADARDGDASRSEVSAAMRSFRAEAEILARMQQQRALAVQDALSAKHAAAVSGLEQALATGHAAATERGVVAAWIGPLADQLELLQGAVAQLEHGPSTDLGVNLALDLSERAHVVSLAAAYDASRARVAAEQLGLRARALRSRASSGIASDMVSVLDARRIEQQRDVLQAQATDFAAIAATATNTQVAAIELAGATP